MKKLFPAVCLLLLLTACSAGPKISDTPSDAEVNIRTDVTMEIVEVWYICIITKDISRQAWLKAWEVGGCLLTLFIQRLLKLSME